MRYSLSILKPDCQERGLTEEVRSLIEGGGFRIILEKRVRLSRDDVICIYGHCCQAEFFEGMAEFLQSGDVVVIVVGCEEGNAFERLNRLVGHTDPAEARVGTIRKLGESIRRNLAHSSADETAFEREFTRLLTQEELITAGLR